MKPPLVIRVPGAPVGKQRPRMGRRGRVYTPEATVSYEHRIRTHAIQAIAKSGWKKTEANVRIWVHVYVPDLRRRDLDNFIKCADALNRLVWEDDAQVVECHGYKKLDRENPRMEITVETTDTEEVP